MTTLSSGADGGGVRCGVALAALCLLAAVAAHAESAALVKDVNAVQNACPVELATSGGLAYFAAGSGCAEGMGLWRSDGTAQGTRRILASQPGTAHELVGQLADVDGTLFFVTGPPDEDGRLDDPQELWRTDGTAAGTRLVRAFDAEEEIFSLLTGVGGVGGRLVLLAADSQHGLEVWSSDGTDAGTQLLKDLVPGPASSFVQSPETSPVKWNGLLFFLARNAADGWDLWRSDGSASGTLQLPDSVAGEDWHAAFLLAGRDGVYFSTGPRGLDLWKTDGSVQGTGPIASLELGGGQYGFSISPEHATLGGNVVFPFASPPSGFELWRTDGTAAGTDLVADVLAGPEGSDPGGLVGLGDIVLFGASGDEVGRELWRSDGSAAGTVLVKDIKPGSESSQPTEPALLGAAAYFFADDGGGRTLWRSDGTDAGTVQVELTPPPAAYGFSGPLRVAEALFFARRDPASGTTLWRSDGTDAGTGAFASLTGTTRDAWINYMIESDGALLFTTGGDQEEHLSDQIWRSDGSEAGTLLVADTNPSGFGDPVFLAEARGSIYFLADDGTHGVELWRLDGTPGSARMVADIRPGPEGSARQLDANPAIVVGGILYFVADDGVHGDELWRSDGTEEGTGLVKDILPGVDSPSVGGFASLGDTLFFSAQHEYLAGYSLWRSDGTEAGTEILVNTALPSGHYDRHPIAAAGDALFFRAGTPNDGFELWRTDGSPSGSERVHMATPGDLDPRFLVPAGDEVFFAATDAEHGAELWRSDGTEEGTSLVADIRPGGEGSIPFPARAAALGRRIFFVAEDGSHGEQLWVSDGTRSTTRRLTDIDPEASSSPGGTLRELTPASDRIFFVAPTPSGTTGIWQSDGTECGAAPIALPEGASDPHTLTVAGPHLFFAAHTQAHGEELWALPVDAKSSGGSCGGPRVSPRLRGSTKVPPKLARR